MRIAKIASLFLLLLSSVSRADKIKLLENNEAALQARVALIESAQSEILFEYFEVADDQFSILSLGLLRAAAERGVKVKILIDSLNNHLTKAEMAATLGISVTTKALKNIEIRIFSPFMNLNPYHLTYRNHDKLLNVDRQRMIIGGRNAAETYFGNSKTINFKDADALVIGASAEKSYRYFMSLWDKNPDVKKLNLYEYSEKQLNSFCGSEEDLYSCEQNKTEILAKIKVADQNLKKQMKFLKSGDLSLKKKSQKEIEATAENVGDIYFAYNDPTTTVEDVYLKVEQQLVDILLKTKRSLTITTPYLYPTETEFTMLETLAQRGVKIKIITNSLISTNKVLAYAGFLSIKSRLAAAGIELNLFKGPEVLHAKGFVMDEKIAFIGSFNFDPRSAELNREIGIVIGHADQQSTRFTKDFVKFINSELFANSVLAAKDKIEYDLSQFDSKNTEQKKNELERMIDLLPFFKSQI